MKTENNVVKCLKILKSKGLINYDKDKLKTSVILKNILK